jgi:hypothetical protein
MKIICLMLVILLVPAADALAQKSGVEQTLSAGKILPKSTLILPEGKTRSEQFVSYVLRDGKRQNLSFLTRILDISLDSNGEEVLRVVQHNEDSSGNNTDISTMMLKSLLPVIYRSVLTTQAENFEFSQNSVKGVVAQKNGDVKNYDVPLEEPVYNAAVISKLIQGLPLSNNYAVSFRAYNPGKQFFTMKLSVAGSEKVSIADGRNLDAWIVRLEGGSAPATYWIAKTTQEEIKQKITLENGDEFWRIRIYN